MLCERSLHLRSYQVIREGDDDECVETFRRKGGEELHPALKWGLQVRYGGGFSVRRSISGCALFVDLEPRLRKGPESRLCLRGRSAFPASSFKNWDRPNIASAGTDSGLSSRIASGRDARI